MAYQLVRHFYVFSKEEQKNVENRSTEDHYGDGAGSEGAVQSVRRRKSQRHFPQAATAQPSVGIRYAVQQRWRR